MGDVASSRGTWASEPLVAGLRVCWASLMAGALKGGGPRLFHTSIASK